jgi:hypothetical protein
MEGGEGEMVGQVRDVSSGPEGDDEGTRQTPGGRGFGEKATMEVLSLGTAGSVELRARSAGGRARWKRGPQN